MNILKSDGDTQYYEEAQVHWISALVDTGIRDLGLCSAQLDALSKHHLQTPCSPLTQKRVLVICSTLIKELDSSGSLKKAIEW